jgi:hypothetical protein
MHIVAERTIVHNAIVTVIRMAFSATSSKANVETPERG